MRRDDATRDAPADNGVPMSRDPTSILISGRRGEYSIL